MPRLHMDRGVVLAVGSPPLVLRDGAELSPNDWERARAYVAVRRMLDHGVIRVESTIEDFVLGAPARREPDPIELFEEPEERHG